MRLAAAVASVIVAAAATGFGLDANAKRPGTAAAAERPLQTADAVPAGEPQTGHVTMRNGSTAAVEVVLRATARASDDAPCDGLELDVRDRITGRTSGVPLMSGQPVRIARLQPRQTARYHVVIRPAAALTGGAFERAACRVDLNWSFAAPR